MLIFSEELVICVYLCKTWCCSFRMSLGVSMYLPRHLGHCNVVAGCFYAVTRMLLCGCSTESLVFQHYKCYSLSFICNKSCCSTFITGIKDRCFSHSTDTTVEECELVLCSCSDSNLIQHILLNALKELLFPLVKLCFARSHATYRPIYTTQTSA